MKDVPDAALEEFDAHLLEGTWYVTHSSFPYWKKKDRHDVRFNYFFRQDSMDIVMFDDRAEYKQGDRQKVFRGVDLQDPTMPSHFTWRGDGGLYGIVNHWYVVGIDPDAGWMVVCFPPSSLGTAAAVEVVFRDVNPSPETTKAALDHIERDPDLRERAKGLMPVRR